MKVNHCRNLNQIYKYIIILQKHGIDHGSLVFRLDFLVIQIHYCINVKSLDYFYFIKYNHIKFKTVAVDHTEDSSFVVLLDFEGFYVRAFKFELETGCVGIHVVYGYGVVSHG